MPRNPMHPWVFWIAVALVAALSSREAVAQEDGASDAAPPVSEAPAPGDAGVEQEPSPAATPEVDAATAEPPTAAPPAPVAPAAVSPAAAAAAPVSSEQSSTPPAADQASGSVDELADLSLESLLDISISVASKSELKASEAPSIV